jgi:hypothetical protein
MGSIATGLEDRKTDTGRMRVSCLELTLLDLLRYPRAAGGLDNIATVVAELGGSIDPVKLAALSASFERSVIQRLGHLLGRFHHDERTGALFETIAPDAPLPWIELEPAQATDPDFTPEPRDRDERWHVTVRRPPESDT